ncbi:MAG: sigma-70 family RNA polymerase sigma factor [Planctomycetota bacterium]
MITSMYSRDTNSIEESEHSLIQRCKNNDKEAFNYFVQQYHKNVFQTIFRMIGDAQEAADLTQEVFIKAYKAIHSFRQESSFRTWIYRIAVNFCISQRRKHSVNQVAQAYSLDAPIQTKNGEITLEPADLTSNPTEILIKKESLQEIETAIQSLAPDFKAVVILRELEDLSYEEISEILEIPKGTVRSRLHRARLELQEKLKHLL